MRKVFKYSERAAGATVPSITSALFTAPPNIRAVARHYRGEHSRHDARACSPVRHARSKGIGSNVRLMTDWPAAIDPPRDRTMQQAFAVRLWCRKPFLLATHWLRDQAGKA